MTDHLRGFPEHGHFLGLMVRDHGLQVFGNGSNQCQFGHHHLQGVVDVMGNTGAHFPQFGHFAGLDEAGPHLTGFRVGQLQTGGHIGGHPVPGEAEACADHGQQHQHPVGGVDGNGRKVEMRDDTAHHQQQSRRQHQHPAEQHAANPMGIVGVQRKIPAWLQRNPRHRIIPMSGFRSSCSGPLLGRPL